MAANLDLPATEEMLDYLRKRTDLLPPGLLTPLNIHSLFSMTVEKTKMRSDPVPEALLSGKFSDAEFEEYFPFRTKLDKGTRRGRANMVYAAFRRKGKKDRWRHLLPYLRNLDYITVCNLMLFDIVHGDWLEPWIESGSTTSLDAFIETAKTVNNRLKKLPAPDELRIRYCETVCATGYRNPPFGDFDFVAETRSLAEGGEPHGMIDDNWLDTFHAAAIKVQSGVVSRPIKYLTLREYIASDLANTSGASSYGKVEWEFKGEKGKFKARKNFLLDICTVDFLYEQTVLHLGKQVNTSFIKSELGKMRIAVTGDIWSYFSQSWLNYLCNGCYLDWPGNTLDESPQQQSIRMEAMRAAAFGGFALPFDYSAFDHQATTEENKILVSLYLQNGTVNVPPTELDFHAHVLSLTVASFSNATVLATEKGVTHTINITGGLQSGIRLTSLVGNYWNQTITQIANDVRAEVGCTNPVQYWLRGDDSAVYSRTYWDVLIFRLSYAGVNAIGNDSKYGIHQGESEFLRVWYGKTRNYGYPNRALPGLMQRKPWSSEPWAAEAVIKAQLDTVDIVSRRTLLDYTWLKEVLSKDWSHYRSLSDKWLALPTCLGGLGYLPFTGWVSSERLPVLDKPAVSFTNINPDTYVTYQVRYPDWPLTPGELQTIQLSTMNAKAASDDIRGLGSVYREGYNEHLASMPLVVWTVRSPLKFDTTVVFPTRDRLRSLVNITQLWEVAATVGKDFGSFRHEQKWWTQTQEVAKVKDIKPFKCLEERNVVMAFFVKGLERKGLHRAAALDYAFGSISGLVIADLHPLLSAVIQSALSADLWFFLSARGKIDRFDWAWYTSTIATWYAETLAMSPVATKLFTW